MSKKLSFRMLSVADPYVRAGTYNVCRFARWIMLTLGKPAGESVSVRTLP